ncbi:MAG: hypothetical protein ACTSO9_01245 [Candidatus Helarchaeota archaeon]
MSKSSNLKKIEDFLIEKMCKIACKFYKEGDNIDKNEKLQCGGFKIMRYLLETNILDEKNLEDVAKKVDAKRIDDKPLTDLDKFLVNNLCKVLCGFYTTDEHGEGDEFLQCGGYRVVRYQIENSIINQEKLKNLTKKAKNNFNNNR